MPANAADKRDIFQAINGATTSEIKINGIRDAKIEELNCNEILDGFKKDLNNNKAYEEFTSAYEAHKTVTPDQQEQMAIDEILGKKFGAQSRSWRIAGSVLCCLPHKPGKAASYKTVTLYK